jgi:hypothetical protein
MSTASEGIPTDSAPRPGQPPSALAILTATALGGMVASRLPKAPLVLAAGATALALLKQRKGICVHSGAREVADVPAEPPSAEAPSQAKVRQWLEQQIHREAEEAVVDLPTPAAVHLPPAEETYVPPAFLLDDEEAASPVLPPDVALLAGPAPRQASPIAPEPHSLTLQALEAPAPVQVADAGWILGIDPLPSIGESPAPPVFTAPVFQGAVLPDEIEVPAPPPAPVVHLTPSMPAAVVEIEPPGSIKAPVEEAVHESVQEIEVQLAELGEASFDPPLTATTHNPWQPPPATADPPLEVAMPVAAQEASSKTVIEAEIVLRPRAPTQASVVAKSRPLTPHFPSVHSTPSSPGGETTSPPSTPGLPPAPQVTPREQRARPTWRSWWRGE